MTIAVGIAKQLRYKVESTWGVAPGATGAQLLRRVTSDLDLKKETYQSNEIRSDYQVADFRHGVRSVDGGINGELSPGTYEDFFAAAVRQEWQTAATTTAIATVTAAATSPQFVRSAGSFLTNGFKVGDVIRWTGWTAPATANNSKNFLITALTATDMTGVFLDGTAVVAKASGDSVTGLLAGKKTWVPRTGHTDLSFSIEHFYTDIVQSELFTGCKVGSMEVQLPATGLSTVNMQFMGKDVTTNTSAYYTSPTAETSSGVLAAVNGALYLGGTAVATVTGLNFTINGNMTGEAVVGSNTRPDIFEGRVTVSGQLTAFFENATFRDYFLNETEAALIGVFTTANTAAADIVVFNMPRIKLGSAQKDDGEKGLVQTLAFTALLNTAGGSGVNSLDTTISIQDSTIV
jgi:hypothetical protein